MRDSSAPAYAIETDTVRLPVSVQTVCNRVLASPSLVNVGTTESGRESFPADPNGEGDHFPAGSR